MTFLRLVLRNLLYHWRGNSAVLLGVAVGTAVLTGALLVGDSLRGSLRDLTEKQLEWVDSAMIGGRFVREDLAGQMPARDVAPAIMLQGAASTVPADDSKTLPKRVGRVTILGVNDRFWRDRPPLGADFWKTADEDRGGVVLNAALAAELRVRVGGKVKLHVQKHESAAPRESILGRRDANRVSEAVELTVRAILDENAPGGRFSLSPSPAAPFDAFVPLPLLQQRVGVPGRVNVLLAGGATGDLNADLGRGLNLDDWGLAVLDPAARFDRLDRDHNDILSLSEWKGRLPPGLVASNPTPDVSREQVENYYTRRGYLSLESRQLYLDPPTVKAALAAAEECHLRAAPTLVYLANSIADDKQSIPYSVVAALDPTQAKPLGPFLPKGRDKLADDEIVLTDWDKSPLKGTPDGSTITLTYFAPEAHGPTETRTATFRLAGRIPLAGVADDPDLAPEFPGITDKTSPGEWEPPSSFNRKDIDTKMKGVHEQYWREYRTTPKAYITLAKGRQLWGSRFGDTTSVRLAPEDDRSLKDAAADFRKRLLAHLKPEDGGLVFDPIRQRALQASAGGNDFGELFLYFSLFLIVAALLLVGLLFRLNLDRRASEIGLLMATGYRRRTVFWLLLGEGAALAAIGGVIGLVAAVFYSWLLLDLLRYLWPGGLEQSILQPHAGATSLVFGFVFAFLVSVGAIFWAMLALRKVPARALLAGETTPAPPVAASVPLAGSSRPTSGTLVATGAPGRRWPISLWVAIIAAVLGVALSPLSTFISDPEMRASIFFGSGLLELIAALAGMRVWLRSAHHGGIGGHGPAALGRLGVRNAARHPTRSLLTAGLLASSAFLLVAVESFRRTAGADFLDKNAGSGGYSLVAESDVPIYQDLNSDKGQTILNDALEQRIRDPEMLKKAEADLSGVTFERFRVRAGDDASCLNLYQPRKPRLLGVPASPIDRGGFHFAGTVPTQGDEKQNPWQLLNRTFDDGAIPVIGEANTVQWMLHSGLDKEIDAIDEHGTPVKLRVVALLSDSVFQSGLLMSEQHFLQLYPSSAGYNFFLIQTPEGRPVGDVKSVLEAALGDHGLEATPSARRLEAYLAVENMYLSTFQMLGGLGLLLGTLGLAVVLLRSVWERRGELALLRALGYRHRALGWLLLSENGFLLLLGLMIGAVTALLAVAPHLIGGEGTVPWPELLGMLAIVLLVGLLTATAALAATLRAPLIPALRRE